MRTSRMFQLFFMFLIVFAVPITLLMIGSKIIPYEWMHDNEPSDEATMWIITGYLVTFGLILYWMREHGRIFYGFLEVVFALYFMRDVAKSGFFSGQAFSAKDIDWFHPTIQLAGALYVFVRGMDNIGTALRAKGADDQPVWPRGVKLWNWLAMKPR